MAAVIRVKRRRNEDPAEALILSQKKSRLDLGASKDDKLDSVLEFAGTLSSKNEPVSDHIKAAIRRKKLRKELHPHSAESKPTSEVISKVRAQNTQVSQSNRYHVICSRRALDIDSLDSGVDSPNGRNPPSITYQDSETTQRESAVPKDSNRCASNSSSSAEAKTAVGSDARVESVHSVGVGVASTANTSGSEMPKGSEADTDKSNEGPTGISDRVFCLLDVDKVERESQPSASGITLNNVPMKSTKAVVPVEEESDDYVYDLYYAHTQLSEQHLGAVLTVEAMCNELLYDGDAHSDDDEEVGDLDEDSNDEGNWRNDYPDADPGFFENEGRDYDFENDMVERNFGGSDDEGDVLAYWMDTRCRIEVDCADFTNEGDEEKSGESSADEYSETADNLY